MTKNTQELGTDEGSTVDTSASEAPLVGDDLLTRIKKRNSSKRELAIECGYSQMVDGKLRVNMTDFYAAILSAKKVFVDAPEGRGRIASYQVKVHKAGVIVGFTYAKQIGLEVGDNVKVIIKGKNILLEKILT